MLRLLIALFFIASIVGLTGAGETPGDRINMAGILDSETREFLSQFQDAVGEGDARRVVELIRFPVLVAVGADSKDMNKDEFLLKYDQIMTQGLVDVVLKAKYEDLIINSSGVGLSLGTVWFSGLCSDSECSEYIIRVVTINGQ